MIRDESDANGDDNNDEVSMDSESDDSGLNIITAQSPSPPPPEMEGKEEGEAGVIRLEIFKNKTFYFFSDIFPGATFARKLCSRPGTFLPEDTSATRTSLHRRRRT